MRKLNLSSGIIWSTLILFCVVILWIFIFQEKKESSQLDQDILILDSDRGMFVDMEPEEEIRIEFLSVNYLIDKEYLMRVEIDGEQIGIIYFDENGEIRFDGDREKFEDAIFKAFDAKRIK